MIRSFRHKGLQAYFESGSKAGIQAAHGPKLNARLLALNKSVRPEEMDVPGWRLHALKGDLKDHWSIWVTGNWRMIFKFEGEDAVLVDYLDYH